MSQPTLKTRNEAYHVIQQRVHQVGAALALPPVVLALQQLVDVLPQLLLLLRAHAYHALTRLRPRVREHEDDVERLDLQVVEDRVLDVRAVAHVGYGLLARHVNRALVVGEVLRPFHRTVAVHTWIETMV